MGAIYVGTSGWTYRHWKERFYPAGLPQREWLAYYHAHFSTVELNVTTYRLPKPTDIARWSAVPQAFRYSIKLSRLITHRRRPGNPPSTVERFFTAVDAFVPRIANVLAQLPPYLKRDDDVLDAFIDALPSRHRYVVEFRHPSWYCDAVFDRLRTRGISLCLHDFAGSVAPLVVTGPVLYVRLHGADGYYAGSYRREPLRTWAHSIAELSEAVAETYIYFNNDINAYAVRNATLLQELLIERAPGVVLPA